MADIVDARYVGSAPVEVPRLGRILRRGDVVKLPRSAVAGRRDFEIVEAPKTGASSVEGKEVSDGPAEDK